jgi:hypothetical protein
MTNKIVFVPLLALAAIGMTACSEKAQTDTAAAANSIAGDVTETARKARDNTDAALGAAEQRMDNFGDSVGAKADRLGERADRAADRAENEADQAGDKADRAADRIGDKANRAADRAGEAAKDIGREIEN